jgi:NAD(P)-dependent dehydrogenase (short-subunit alcohol dehydrogenase family)
LEVVEELTTFAAKNKCTITYRQCNVTDDANVNLAFEEADVESRFPLRGLVTCAGISGRYDAVDYPIDDFRRIIDVNLVGSFLCARAAARIFHRHMVKGSIVMLASMSGHVANQVINILSLYFDNFTYKFTRRASIPAHITRPRLVSCNLHATWQRNGVAIPNFHLFESIL